MDWDGLDGLDLCAGLFYEHRFAMLIRKTRNICIQPAKCKAKKLGIQREAWRRKQREAD